MKKIKKAAVLVPAFATVVLATVGSVTGTMAWFTANRTATTTASVFEATSINPQLAITATARVGTVAATKANDVAVDGLLTAASYDAGGNLYNAIYGKTDIVSESGIVTTASQYDGIVNRSTESDAFKNNSNWTAGSKTVDSKEKTIWYGVSWIYKFTFSAENATGKYALVLDPAASVFADATTNGKTKPGFRISLSNGTLTKVLGGDSTTPTSVTAETEKTATYTGGYHIGTTTTVASDKTYLSTLEKYDSTKYILIHDGTKLANYQKAAAYEASPLYFGTFDSTTTSFEYTCVAWFEGTDSAIVDASIAEGVNSLITATLKFELCDINLNA